MHSGAFKPSCSPSTAPAPQARRATPGKSDGPPPREQLATCVSEERLAPAWDTNAQRWPGQRRLSGLAKKESEQLQFVRVRGHRGPRAAGPSSAPVAPTLTRQQTEGIDGTKPGHDRAHCHQRRRVHDGHVRERGWPEAARPTVPTVAAPHARQQTMMPCGFRCNANDARRCVAAARLACAARQSATTATEIVNEQLAPDCNELYLLILRISNNA